VREEFGATWEFPEAKVSVVYYDNWRGVQDAWVEASGDPFVDVEAFTIMYPHQRSCQMHVRDPHKPGIPLETKRRLLEILGHEVMHCFRGSYHDD
jgi:hypothetical protein